MMEMSTSQKTRWCHLPTTLALPRTFQRFRKSRRMRKILQKYFSRLADDLEVYSAHAKRKTIEVEDVELLMKRCVGHLKHVFPKYKLFFFYFEWCIFIKIFLTLDSLTLQIDWRCHSFTFLIRSDVI
uniref:CENP-T/Histone H4 histone fold domain-containing protein n=1 Tax=Electrophorus electricus TaxID=8005 RepID=A0A4W4GF49_ELEEL